MKHALLGFLTLMLCACTTTGETDGPIDTGPREGYPAAPYGVTAESVIENHTFTGVDGQPVTFQDIYADGANRLLLISTAAGWCTACIEEQPKLQDLHETFAEQGLVVVLSYFEDADYNRATPEQAAAWKERHNLELLVVSDPDLQLGAYYDVNLTPMNMIVDIPSMEIVWLTTGWDQSTIDALIQSKL